MEQYDKKDLAKRLGGFFIQKADKLFKMGASTPSNIYCAMAYCCYRISDETDWVSKLKEAYREVDPNGDLDDFVLDTGQLIFTDSILNKMLERYNGKELDDLDKVAKLEGLDGLGNLLLRFMREGGYKKEEK